MPRSRKRGAKSQAAREMMAAMPGATASAIVAALAEKGMKVQPQLIYSLRARSGQAAATSGRGRGRAVRSSNGQSSLSEVGEILRLVDRIGVGRAKRILEAIEG